jgi:uncharacterized membrane protein
MMKDETLEKGCGMDRNAPNRAVRKLGEFVTGALLTGALIATPIYLAALLLLKVAKSLSAAVRPLARILPEWLPAERILSLLLVLLVCFLIGLTVRIPKGRAAWEQIENSLSLRIPGYEIFRSVTHRLAGQTQDEAWKPALAEIEEALVPAFIVEEMEDGSCTVFVPSAPTPISGTIYILTPDRVHPLDIPFTHILKAISRCGSGSKYLAAAMERTKTPSGDRT